MMKFLIILFSLAAFYLRSQTVSHIYKTEDLVKRIAESKTPIVVNFWATWCKPCVQELPALDSLQLSRKDIKVLLVSLDFREDIKVKVEPFLQKKRILSEVILLDEVNGNDFINKIHPSWTGAIPATLFRNEDKVLFMEKKMNLKAFSEMTDKVIGPN